MLKGVLPSNNKSKTNQESPEKQIEEMKKKFKCLNKITKMSLNETRNHKLHGACQVSFLLLFKHPSLHMLPPPYHDA